MRLSDTQGAGEEDPLVLLVIEVFPDIHAGKVEGIAQGFIGLGFVGGVPVPEGGWAKLTREPGFEVIERTVPVAFRNTSRRQKKALPLGGLALAGPRHPTALG